MRRYIIRRILWGVALLFICSAVIFLIFYRPPTSADPRSHPRRASGATPEADREDPREPRPRRADLHPVLSTTSGTWSCTSTSATATSANVPVGDPDLRTSAGDDLTRHRRLRSSGWRSGSRWGSSAQSEAALAARPNDHGDHPGVHLPPRSSGSAWSRSTCSPDDVGAVPDLPRHRLLHADLRERSPSWAGALILPWTVLHRVGAIYARYMRSSLMEHDVRGLHPHRWAERGWTNGR